MGSAMLWPGLARLFLFMTTSHMTSHWTKCINRLDQSARGEPSRLPRQQQAQRTADLCTLHTRNSYQLGLQGDMFGINGVGEGWLLDEKYGVIGQVDLGHLVSLLQPLMRQHYGRDAVRPALHQILEACVVDCLGLKAQHSRKDAPIVFDGPTMAGSC
jgi:hypothetical protein